MCGKTPMRVIGGCLAMFYVTVGLTFFVLGFVLQVAPASSLMMYINPYTNRLNSLMAPADAQFNPLEFAKDFPNITGNIASAFIAMGAVQSIIGVVGIVALCSGRQRSVLTAFFVMIAIMVALQFALIVLYYALRVPIATSGKAAVQKAINEKYTGHNTTNMETILINVIQLSLSCCGINGGQDFDRSTSWPRAIRWRGKLYDPVSKPLTCCKSANYTACLMTNHTNFVYTNVDKGCWGDLESMVQNNIIYAALGTGALILLEVLLLAFTASMCYTGRMKPQMLDMDQPHM